MTPAGGTKFRVMSQNGFKGCMSADAFGITVCLYAYSLLSFPGHAFAEVYAKHAHPLWAFALNHAEAHLIASAIDWRDRRTRRDQRKHSQRRRASVASNPSVGDTFADTI